MSNLEIIGEELHNKIKQRFPSLKIAGDDAKIVVKGEEARIFSFSFGNSKYKISMRLTEDKLVVIYSTKMLSDDSQVNNQEWYDFIKELKSFASKHLIGFEPRDIEKSNLDTRDYKLLSLEEKKHEPGINESRLYGSSRISYQRINNAKLIIKHTHDIDQENPLSRSHQIGSIFIESPDDERFKYPYRHLSGARAMAQHISEGGNPYDDFGKHIIGLSEELSKLRKFKTYMNRSSVMAEGLSDYMDIVTERIQSVKKTISKMQKLPGYQQEFESFEKPILEDVPENITQDWIDQLTIKQFNEELKDVFPYIYKLINETPRVKNVNPDDILNSDNFEAEVEDSRSYTNTPEELEIEEHFDSIINQNTDFGYQKTTEAHGNSKIYDRCWRKYRKKPGARRGEKGSCIKKESKQTIPVTEFILSHFDLNTRKFPKGETAILTMIEKQYGEQYINTSKNFIEKIKSLVNEQK